MDWDWKSTVVLVSFIAVFAVGAYFIKKMNKARKVEPKK